MYSFNILYVTLISFTSDSSLVVIIIEKSVKHIKGIVLKHFKLMTRSPNYMSGIETYLYNDMLHNDKRSFVRYHSDENDNRNHIGILNLLKEEVSFTIEVFYAVNILYVNIIHFF